MNNSEKTVLVTGASRGIGRAIALAAAGAGYKVLAHYNRSEKEALSLRDEISQKGGNVELIKFDVSAREDSRTQLEAWLSAHEAPWGIVLNAGVNADNTFPALSDNDWDKVIHTNLDGLYNVVKPLFMPLARKRRGRIVTIASVSGIMGNRGQVNYSASKAGVIGASKALALELGSRSITVNCVAPGLIDTAMAKTAPLDTVLPMIPLRRIGRPEEVAALVVFLLSEEAGYITRQVISINGGLV
jgi:3-oxoacyl-[acyl-carrier protein] reductase